MAVAPENVERRMSEGSTDSLKCLNDELREHLCKLRAQLEHQKGSIKHAHWEKVLNIRIVRQQEQKRAATTIANLRAKLQREKIQEVDHQVEVVQQKHEQDVAKLRRVHHAQVVKLKLELQAKESLLRRFIIEARRDSMKCGSESGRTKLIHRLSELQSKKKELEDSLMNAGDSERQFAYELRRKVEQFEADLWKVKNESKCHMGKLIEQLKSKDKIISHLERELGRRSGYALSESEEKQVRADLLKKRGVVGTHPGMKMEADSSERLSSSPNKYGNGFETNAKIANIAIVSPADGEQKRVIEPIKDLETEIRDLQMQISSLQQEKDERKRDLAVFEEKNRQLLEKNKRFLEKNIELTSAERSQKDQTQSLTEENLKLKDQYEHSKLKISQLTRQLYNAKGECSNLVSQVKEYNQVKQQLMEQEQTIAALRESCSEKDRRIELIQHRKKRRRILKSQEKANGVKETFYGYDEDNRSVDSENSQSSTVSYGNTSESDLWDEVSREQMNKNYERLMKEHHQLEKSFALLQTHTASQLDPQREHQVRSELEADLFAAHCRIEELENAVQTEQKMETQEMLFMTNEILLQKNQAFDIENKKQRDKLFKYREMIDNLEFRLIELEASQLITNIECSSEENSSHHDEESALTSLTEMADRTTRSDLSELRHEFTKVLEGQGLEADVILKKMDTVLKAEQKIESLECTANELQRKVSSLQEEKAALEEMLLTPRHGAPHATSNEKERADVLALKNQVEILEKSQLELMAENSSLQNKLQKCEFCNNLVKKQMEDLKHSIINSDSPLHKEFAKSDKKSQTVVQTTDKGVYVNSSTKIPNNEVISLEHKLQILYEENLKLKCSLEEKCLLNDGSEQPRVEELEEYCEDLQERMQNAEMSERQLREKLKLAEHTINDLENSEGHFRETVDYLTSREQETKRQTHELHRTVRELKEIVVDKDIVEQALREKVEFLEKADAESSKLITELQASEKSLRQQLELQSDLEGDVYIVNQLREEIHVLKSTNKELCTHIAELNENEEILRDNWRRVADEDADRRQCLEEKIKMLESMNQELKVNLEETKDHFAFTRIPQNASLASELSAWKSVDNIVGQSYLSDQVLELEAKIKTVEEKKDAKIEQLEEKIENLQEKIGNLRENEIKLSETLAEMETSEQEQRIKISLYESKQVTVERMLRYEDEIKELHTSQENLLEQLDSMEDNEDTLQEKLETMEKIHKAKVNSIEKKMRILNEEREKAKLKINEVEKEIARLQQKCLDYSVKIEELEKELTEAKSREIEAAAKIKKLQQEIQKKESDALIQIEILKKEFEQKTLSAKSKVIKLENNVSELTQKDSNSEAKLFKLEKEISELREEKITLSDKVSDLKIHEQGIVDKLQESQKHEQTLLKKLNETEKYEQEFMEKLSERQKTETQLLSKISDMENHEKELLHNLNCTESSLNDKMSSLTKQLTDSNIKNESLTTELSKVQKLVKQYLLKIHELESKEKHLTDVVSSLEESRTKSTAQLENKIKMFEQDEVKRTARISELNQREESSTAKITQLMKKSQRLTDLEREQNSLQVKVTDLETLKREQQDRINVLQTKLADMELSNKNADERILSLEKILLEYQETVAENSTQIEQLKSDNKEFTQKCSELESTVENRDALTNLLKSHISNQKKDVDVKNETLDKLKKELKEKNSKISSLESELRSLKVKFETVRNVSSSVDTEKKHLQEQSSNLQKNLDQCKQEMQKIASEKSELLKNVFHFKHLSESLENEKREMSEQVVSKQNENELLEQKVKDLEKRIELLGTEKDSELQGNVTQLKQTVNELQTEGMDHAKKYDSVISENDNQKLQICELKNIKENLEKRLHSISESESLLVIENKDLKTKINNYEKKLNDLNSTKTSRESEICNLHSLVESLKADKENIQSSNKFVHGEKEKVQTKLSGIQSERDELSRQVSDVKSEKHDLEMKMKQLSADLDSSQNENSDLKICVEDLDKDRVELHDQLQLVEKNNQELEKVVTDLKHSYSVLEKKCDILQDAEQHLMDRVTELEEIEQELRQSHDLLVSQRTAMFSRSETTLVKCDSSTDTTDLKDYASSPNLGGRKVSTMFTRVQDLDSENHQLSAKLREMEMANAQTRQLREKNRLLEQSEDKLMERVMELEEGEERMRTDLERMRTNSGPVGDLEAELSKLTKSESEWKVKWNSVVEDNCALEESMHKLEDDLKVERNSNTRLLSVEKEYERKMNDILNDKEKLEKMVCQIKSELEAEKLNVKNLEKSTSGLDCVVKEKSVLSERVHILSTQIAEEMSKTNDLLEQLKSVTKDRDSLSLEVKHFRVQQVKNDKLSTSMSEKQKIVEELESKLSLAKKQFEVAHSRSEKQRKEFDRELAELNEKLSKSQQMVTDLQVKTREMSQNEGKLRDEMSVLARQETEVKSEIQTVESKLTGMCDQMKCLQEENSTLKSRCEDLIQKQQTSEELEQNKIKPLAKPVLPKIGRAFMTSSSGPQSRYSVSKPHQFGAVKAMSSLKQRNAASGLVQSDSSEKVFQEKITQFESVMKQQGRELKDLLHTNEILQEQEKQYKEKITVLEKQNTELQEKYSASVEEITKLQNGASLSNSTPCVLPIQSHRTEKGFMSVTHLNIVNSRVVPSEQTNTTCAKSPPAVPTRPTELSKTKQQDLSAESRIHELEIKIKSEKKRNDHLESELEQAKKMRISLTQRITEFELSEKLLNQKLFDLQQNVNKLSEKLASAEKALSSVKCDGNHINFLTRIEQLESREKLNIGAGDHKHQDVKENLHQVEQSEKSLKLKIKSFEEKSSQPTTKQKKAAMLDKPEDILMQQIKELERLEKHQKQQISDLEVDRERLHGIARKDKSLIHEQNVRIRELQLGEKVLREQVSSYEQSERSLYCKCEELEAQVSKMEDRIHELNIHERRLRELVRKLKLDEELWLAKSENMELTVEELSASEANLKARLQELAEEKFGLAEKANYLDARIKELEMSETTLFQRVKNYEHFEASLQGEFCQLENAKVAAQSKVSELDMMNMDMSQRYQRAVEENAVFLKHVQEQQGLVQDLSRQLMVVKDSELCLKQQVESLERSETTLQKRVKEYQLREIDFQSHVNELTQSELILKDRVNTLQRNNNKMKYRIQESEDIGLKSGEMSSKKEVMPQKLEDCQKRIEVLQKQVKSLQSRGQLTLSVSDDTDVIKVPRTQFEKMETKMALLGEVEVQMAEVEKVNTHLKDTISQLRQGKDLCGHEVELEAYRKRLQSYEELVHRLKQNLSKEQVTSLWDSDSDNQGPSMEILPKRNLQFLESERVMHTVRGLTGRQLSSGDSPPWNKSVDTSSNISGVEEDSIEPIKGSSLFKKAGSDYETDEEPLKSVAQLVKNLESHDNETAAEEEHWKTIESMNTNIVETTPVSNGWKSVAKATSSGSPKNSSKQEELVIGLTLPSESELSHCISQNDSDSTVSSPHLKRAKRTALQDSSTESTAPPLPRTEPPSLSRMKGFAQGTSYYLPSLQSSMQDASADESFISESVRRQNTATSLDTSSVQTSRTAFSLDSVADSGRGTASTSRSNIRDRIALIERQLQGKDSGAESRIDDNDSVFTWSKTVEKSKLEASETEVKQMKDDINKLEKELEEKRRHIEILENWTTNIEKMLKNKDKLNDRNIVQTIQTETVKLRAELRTSKYRREDLLQDPAAMKTELDNRDRELAAKKNLIDSLTHELHQWQQECRSIEDMRANALDSLRDLELEVSELQETERQLHQMNYEYNKLKKQLGKLNIIFEVYQKEKSELKHQIHRLNTENENLSLEILRLSCVEEEKELLLQEKEQLKGEISQLESDKEDLGLEISHLDLLVEEKQKVKTERDGVKDEIEQMKTLLQNRMDRVESLKEENKKLQESISELKTDSDDLRKIKHQYDDLKSRFELMQSELREKKMNEDNITKSKNAISMTSGNRTLQEHKGKSLVETQNIANISSVQTERIPDSSMQQVMDRLQDRVEHLEAARLIPQSSECPTTSSNNLPSERTPTKHVEVEQVNDSSDKRVASENLAVDVNDAPDMNDSTQRVARQSLAVNDNTAEAEGEVSMRSYDEFLAESGLTRPRHYTAKRPLYNDSDHDHKNSVKPCGEAEHAHQMVNCDTRDTHCQAIDSSSNQMERSKHKSTCCQMTENYHQSERESTKCEDNENVSYHSTLQSEIKILQSHCSELEKLKSDLQARLKVSVSKLDQMRNVEVENDCLKKKVSALTDERDKVKQLEVKTATLEKQCEVKSQEIRKLQDQIKSLQSLEMENLDLKQQVEAKVLELQFLSCGDLSAMKSRLKQLTNVERENLVLNQQLEENMSELEKLKQLYYRGNYGNDDTLNNRDCGLYTEFGSLQGNCFDRRVKMTKGQELGVGCSGSRSINVNSFSTQTLYDVQEENKLLKLQLESQKEMKSHNESKTVSNTSPVNMSETYLGDHTLNLCSSNTSYLPSLHPSIQTSSTGNQHVCMQEPGKSVTRTGANTLTSACSVMEVPTGQSTEIDANKVTESKDMLITLRSKLEQLQQVEIKNFAVQKKLEESAILLKYRYDELEKLHKDSPDITTLQSQVAQLTQKCKEKDELIKRLMKELQSLRQGETTPSPLLAEVSRAVECEDYSHLTASSTPVSIIISPADQTPQSPPQNTTPVSSSTPVTESKTSIQPTSTTQTPQHTSITSATQTLTSRPRPSPRVPIPPPPKNFHILRLVGNTGIMLSWEPTKLIEDENSNNPFVMGYRLFLDGKICQQISNPRSSKTVIENIDVSEPHHFAIQTVAVNDQTSARVELIYEGIELPPQGDSDGGSSLDTSINSSFNFDEKYKRLFMGVYDYNPQKQPDQYYTKYELAFHAGDIIAVYGEKRPDGYYHGEIDGRRGLVPSIFIEEVPSSNKSSPNSLSSSLSPRPPRSRSPRTPESRRRTSRS